MTGQTYYYYWFMMGPTMPISDLSGIAQSRSLPAGYDCLERRFFCGSAGRAT